MYNTNRECLEEFHALCTKFVSHVGKIDINVTTENGKDPEWYDDMQEVRHVARKFLNKYTHV